MPSNDRIKKAAIGLVLALTAVLVGYVAAVAVTGVPEFVPGTGPAPMVGEVGSGLHLPLGGGR